MRLLALFTIIFAASAASLLDDGEPLLKVRGDVSLDPLI
jgi:hypothetical protein